MANRMMRRTETFFFPNEPVIGFLSSMLENQATRSGLDFF
jgi:hypothetical protein